MIWESYADLGAIGSLISIESKAIEIDELFRAEPIGYASTFEWVRAGQNT